MQKVHEIKGEKIVNKSDFALNYIFLGGFSVKMYLQFDEYFENLIYITKIICVCVCVCAHGYLRNPLNYDREILYA